MTALSIEDSIGYVNAYGSKLPLAVIANRGLSLLRSYKIEPLNPTSE